MSRSTIPVIDLFAGPGGLGEGFSSVVDCNGRPAFQIGLSVEMDPAAHMTLELRSFFRQFVQGSVPDDYYAHLRGEISRDRLFARFPTQAHRAQEEAWLAELGEVPATEVHRRIDRAIKGSRNWVLCGGPPCQAYSVVGRSRRGGIDHRDKRVYLYKEYLEILAQHEPAVFIMENVKGLLSSAIKGRALFTQILTDLRAPSLAVGKQQGAKYLVRPLILPPGSAGLSGSPAYEPHEFVVKSETFGVPQSRHRVILFGIRQDLAERDVPALTRAKQEISIAQVLHGLPKLRSGLTRTVDSYEKWREVLSELLTSGALMSLPNGHYRSVRQSVLDGLAGIRDYRNGRGAEFIECSPTIGYRPDWFLDKRIGGVLNHVSRPHMAPDLHRYLFAISYAHEFGRSPELRDFPVDLLPAHRNVHAPGKEEYFDDRFRVQVANRPATTITCHIAKDGHYYLHYDPSQCRSLTVREAARVQTFPDNYFFCGTRTAQYRQVGNAVPPLLAHQIARAVLGVIRPQ